MISKLRNIGFVPRRITKIAKKYVSGDSRLKCNVLKENKIVSRQTRNFKRAGQVILNKAKSVKKSLSKFFGKLFAVDSARKTKKQRPLSDKELRGRIKFIRDTEIYDPNSPNYLHTYFSRTKKGAKRKHHNPKGNSILKMVDSFKKNLTKYAHKIFG